MRDILEINLEFVNGWSSTKKVSYQNLLKPSNVELVPGFHMNNENQISVQLTGRNAYKHFFIKQLYVDWRNKYTMIIQNICSNINEVIKTA